MDANKILIRLTEIRRETGRAVNAICDADSKNCSFALDVIELHIQAIRAELGFVGK